MKVGIYFEGRSLVEPIKGIELKRCITFDQLAKCEIRLLENVKKDKINKIQQLPSKGVTYCIGACDSAVKAQTIPITSLEEILNAKGEVIREQQKNIVQLKDTIKEKTLLEKKLENSGNLTTELRTRLKQLKIKDDKNTAIINDLTKKVDGLTSRLNAESQLRQKAEQDLSKFKEGLGTAIEELENKSEDTVKELNTQHQTEIAKINQIVADKDKIIDEKNKEIEELKRINDDLSKAGVIPDISYDHTGKTSRIIGFCGEGSYGVSNIAYSVSKILSETAPCLIIDLDFNWGNIGKYLQSENRCIENILKGGPLLREHILKTIDGKMIDYIGGIDKAHIPYEIIKLPWNDIFSGDYKYIICDCGIYHKGYDIQTKICENIIKNGQMFFIHKTPTETKTDCINILNQSRTNQGIPFISEITIHDKTLLENQITKFAIQNLIINQIK